MKSLLKEDTIQEIVDRKCKKEIDGMFLTYKGEIQKFCKYYYTVKNLSFYYDFDELVNSCYFGFIEACARFDKSKGKFVSYLSYYLKREMLLLFQNKLIKQTSNRWGLRNEHSKKMYDLSRNSISSLDWSIDNRSESVVGSLRCKHSNVEDTVIKNSVYEMFDDYCYFIGGYSKDVFKEWMLTGKSLATIGKKHNVSKERIRQITDVQLALWNDYLDTVWR